jgi:hypothetical protein
VSARFYAILSNGFALALAFSVIDRLLSKLDPPKSILINATLFYQTKMKAFKSIYMGAYETTIKKHSIVLAIKYFFLWNSRAER